MIYRGTEHEKLFRKELRKIANSDKVSYPEGIAALYLLTADKQLWSHFNKNFKIGNPNIDKVNLHGVCADDYTLCKVAQDLIEGTEHLTISDLANASIVNDKTYKIINTAINLARNGMSLHEFKKEIKYNIMCR